MSLWSRLFSTPPILPLPKPSIESVKIQIEVDGLKKDVTPKEFEDATGVRFAPWLEIKDPDIHRAIAKLKEKLHKKGRLSFEQLWLGRYYQKEIESGYSPKLTLRFIDNHLGWGVFAARDFKPKEYIAEYTGLLRPWRRRDRKNGYCFEYVHESGYPTRFLIDAQEQAGIARYINHSSNGNLKPHLATLGSITHLILLVKRPIVTGEQLCYDYGPAYWSHRKDPLPLGDQTPGDQVDN